MTFYHLLDFVLCGVFAVGAALEIWRFLSSDSY